MTEVTNNELADAIEKADWSSSSIGNKCLLLLAVSRLRNTPSVSDSAGWIEWNGGLCPVDRETFVDVRLRDGSAYERQLSLVHGTIASTPYWRHDNSPSDIVAYRISK